MMFSPHNVLLFGMAFTRTSSVHRHGRFGVADRRHGRSASNRKRAAPLSAEGSGDGHGCSDSDVPPPSPSQAELDVLRLAQSHFASQALLAIFRLGVLDVLDCDHQRANSVDEILTKLHSRANHDATTINRDALFRCLRLICTTGVVDETTKSGGGGNGGEPAYFRTEMGNLLASGSDGASMAPFFLHWAESPLWDAWSKLEDYVAGDDMPPFDREHGMSASEFYKNNPDSCSHRNAVARYGSSNEISSILDSMQSSSVLNESNLAGKVIVDVGGGYGDLMHAVKKAMPGVGECHCLDLPHVIADASSAQSTMDRAFLVPGDMFDPSTIPPCDLIFSKHVLCDFSDGDVIRALRSFHGATSKEGRVVVMDAVLPNGDELNGKWNAAVSFDVLLMLTGRRGERSRHEWANLAEKAGFVLEVVLPSSVTVDLAILSKA